MSNEQLAMSNGKIFFLFSFFFLLSHALFGQDVPLSRIVDDSALRTSVKDTWLIETPSRVLPKARLMNTLPGGGRVELRVEATKDEFMVIFARELKNSNGNGGAASSFPGWAQGSWILTRRRDNGAAERIRIFLRSDPYMYIQFRPFSADKCQMDVVLYEAYIVRSLTLPVTLERLYTMQLGDVLKLAGDQFPRRYFEPKPDDYRLQRQFISKVREQIKGLEFADDGAIDQRGNYVYINTGLEQRGQPGLNCSGFAKWLVDGILRPVTGERLELSPLKEPYGTRGSSFTDIWEKQRDPFFGLDWIRNLASTAWSKLLSPAFGNLDEIEVRTDLFSYMTLRDPKNNKTEYSYPGFLTDAGYGVEGLLPLLYTLAIDEPGKFYLAAVNNEIGPPSTETNPQGKPRMRQYFHIAAFVPYFSESGIFHVAVFESAAETSIQAFRNRYPLIPRTIDGEKRLFPNGHYVNLVRIPVQVAFEP